MITFSIRTRLMAVITGIVILSGIFISQVVTNRYAHSLLETAMAQTENITHNMALDAADKILINDLVGLRKLIEDRMRSNPAVSYVFILSEDRILTHTFKEGIPEALIKANIPVDDHHGRAERIVSEKGVRYLDMAWPIFGNQAGVLRIGFLEQLYLKDVDRLRMQITLITVGVLIVSLLVGNLFVRRITRQLVQLTGAVEKINEEHMEIDVGVQRRDEVGKLSAAFNEMLRRLKDYTGRLKDSRRQIESANQELERAHRQAKTAFEIARELGSIPDIESICRFLLEKLKTIITCRQMVILIFEADPTALAVFSEDSTLSFPLPEEQITQFAARASSPGALPRKQIPIAVAEFQKSETVATFPILHENRVIGAMCVGCPGECSCLSNEMDVIELVLAQSAGAIRRASIHETEVRDLRLRIEQTSGYGEFIGKDPQMQMVYKLIEDVAPSDATVLILGESGTGKELAARAIHEKSPRKNGPFVVINCSAYPSTLLESELFGYEKGAFTGALKQKMGRFEQADGGTIFLDEIGEISSTAQIKLLRVLQNRSFERIGGDRTLSVDVRILAATNRDLLQEVKKGAFREDLFYRLNVIPIHLPPLRNRMNDIPLLARSFLSRFCAEQNKPAQEFSSAAMRALLSYPWPGNVRELENSIEHAVVLARGKEIQVSDLPQSILEPAEGGLEGASRSLQENERDLLVEALEACGWNKAEAARRLGIGRSTLYSKMKKYALSGQDGPNA